MKSEIESRERKWGEKQKEKLECEIRDRKLLIKVKTENRKRVKREVEQETRVEK